jgi:hypothetical protein
VLRAAPGHKRDFIINFDIKNRMGHDDGDEKVKAEIDWANCVEVLHG